MKNVILAVAALLFLTVAEAQQPNIAVIPAVGADRYELGIDEHFIVPAESGVLANESDPDALVVLRKGPAHGQLELLGDGSLIYLPNPGYVGEDSFTYTASGGEEQTTTLDVGVRPTGQVSLEAYMNGVNIKKGIDDLLSAPSYPDSPGWVAHYDTLEAHTPDRAFPHGPGDSGLRFRGYVHPPATGEYTFYNAGGHFEFQLSADDSPKELSSVVSGSGNELVASAPVHLEASNRYYFQSLVARGNKDDYFRVEWSGPGLVRQVISSDYLSHIPLVPRALPDTFATYEGQTLEIRGSGKDTGPGKREGVLANDVIPMWKYDEIVYREGLTWLDVPSSVKLVSDVKHGTLTFNENGTFVYQPAAGFTGTDSFTYQLVSDGDFLSHRQGAMFYTSVPAEVNIEVAAGPRKNPQLLDGVLAYWPFESSAEDALSAVRTGGTEDAPGRAQDQDMGKNQK